jgi:diacylglycerol kinase (ATP)
MLHDGLPRSDPMHTTEYFVILNPQANRGGARRQWSAAEAVLAERGVRYSLTRTRGRGHATELAARAVAEGWPAVIAMGGDGTVHEVVNGLLLAPGDAPATVPLGIVPIGSGNDFVKLLGLLRGNARRAMEHLLSAPLRRVDVGRLNGEYFTNGVGIGFDARVAAAAQKVVRLRGMAIYAWALLKVLSAHETPHMRVVIDGVEIADRPLTLVTVGNGGCHGGGFWICPGACVDDGVFDVCMADAMPVRQLLRLLPYVMRGRHLGRPGVQLLRGRRVEIHSSAALPIHADGEILDTGATSLLFEILPGRLSVLA